MERGLGRCAGGLPGCADPHPHASQLRPAAGGGRPGRRSCRAPAASSASFGGGGEHAWPPRLAYFYSRAIGRPEAPGAAGWPGQPLPCAEELDEASLPERLTDRYLLRRLLGRGSFGRVHSVIDRATGLEWAAKILPKRVEGKDPARVLHNLREEVAVLRQLQARSETLRLHEVIEDERWLVIVTEVCYGGDLEQLLRERGHLTEAEAAPVIHAALSVLEECHRRGLCYGDIKPGNFLLKWPFPSVADPQALPDIRVADFGCAQALAPGVAKKPGGTPLYVAPEQFMQRAGLCSDVWGLGMLFYQLLCGRLPFADSFQAGRSPMDVMMAILSEDVKFEGPRWALVSPAARSLVMRMLDRDYQTRVTPGDALLDPWLLERCRGGTGVWLPSEQPPRNCASGF